MYLLKCVRKSVFYSKFLEYAYSAYNLQYQYKEQRYYDSGYIRSVFFALNKISYYQADYYSTRFEINAIVGYAPWLWELIGFDIYVGFGVRFLSNHYGNVLEGGYTSNSLYKHKINYEGVHTDLYLAGGLKIFYIL